MPKLSIYNLGDLGVDVDSDPAHSTDGTLTKAQNAIRDPLGGLGALRNRPGLTALNGSAAAGSISGGVGVPLANNVAATRNIYVGRGNSTATGTALGWAKNTNGNNSFTTSATPSVAPRGYDKLANYVGDFYVSNLLGAKSGCFINNKLYYAGNDYTLNTTAPPIHVFDGTTDVTLCVVPTNPDVSATAVTQAVLSLISVESTIYVSTVDGGVTLATAKCRVFQLDITTGVLTILGATFPTGHVPITLTYWLGRVWAGTAADTGVAGRVYSIRPGIDTAWTLELTLGSTAQSAVTSLCVFQGQLYAATFAALGTDPIVKRRTTLGVWSTVETGPGAGGASWYPALVSFNGLLITMYFDQSGSSTYIRASADGTTWVEKDAGFSVSHYPVAAWTISNSVLFGCGIPSQGGIMYTADGTTWANATQTNSPMAVFAGTLFT